MQRHAGVFARRVQQGARFSLSSGGVGGSWDRRWRCCYFTAKGQGSDPAKDSNANSTKLNVIIGNDASCIAATIAAADAWMAQYGPVGSGVRSSSAARSFGERGASAPCFPERGKASARSAGAETADSRPPLAGDPKAITAGAALEDTQCG